MFQVRDSIAALQNDAKRCFARRGNHRLSALLVVVVDVDNGSSRTSTPTGEKITQGVYIINTECVYYLALD